MQIQEYEVRSCFGRLFLVAVCLLSLSSSTHGQTSPRDSTTQDISFAPRWSKGEVRLYEQTKGRQVTPSKGAMTKASGKSRVEIKVIEANPKGFVLSWTISGTTLEGQDAGNLTAELAGLIKAMEGWSILIDLDESGNFKGVRNWKDIQSRLNNLTDSIVRSRNFTALPPEQQKKLKAQLHSRLQSREQIEELCTREAKAFLAPIGLVFKGGQPIDYESQLPNPRGGKPFDAKAQFALARIDPATARAIVDWRQVIDPGVPSAGLGDKIGRLGKSLGRPPAPGDPGSLKALSITDRCQYLMDMRTGWVNDMKQVRTIKNEDGSSVEELLRIRRIDPRQTQGSEATKAVPKPR